MLLLCSSIAELFAHYKTIWASIVQFVSPAFLLYKQQKKILHQHLISDPAPKHERVPFAMYGGGILVSIIFTCIILGIQYKQNVGITLLAIFFAFLFSFITAESCGRTSIIPVFAVGELLSFHTRPSYCSRLIHNTN